MRTAKQRHRPALIALVVVAAAVCLVLAWWQWNRFESTSGSGQNLGYALQWPMFAVAVVYAYRRFVVLESDPDAVARLHPGPSEPTELPADLLPLRPSPTGTGDQRIEADDPALADYNRYLAELSERENT